MRWLGLQVTVMVSWTPVKFSVMLHTPHDLFNMLNKLWEVCNITEKLTGNRDA